MEIQRLPVARNAGEALEYLRLEYSYIGEFNLAASEADQEGGVELPYAGYGLYLSYQGTPPGTQLRVFFNRDFAKSVLFTPGTFHRPGQVTLRGRRAHNFFEVVSIQRTEDSVSSGTAYLVVLGTPEAEYREDPSGVGYSTSGTATVTTSDAVAFGPQGLSPLQRTRLYVHNEGAVALGDVFVEGSPDGENWEEVLSGQFSALGADVLRSRELPFGLNHVRVRASTDAGSADATFWISGRY